MNARTETPALPGFRHLPLGLITLSTTGVQALRRKRFDPAKTQELAASMQSHGVIEPIVVRPISDARYEIVAGERRYLAAQTAGLDSIPATIRTLDDQQVLEVQLIENLQRDNLQPLEEAQGFRELMQMHGLSADALAERLGKSRSQVYARLKLLELCPEAQDALQAGTIDASKALLLSRLPAGKVQVAGLKRILTPLHGGWMPSFRDAFQILNNHFMQDLTEAPFALDDPSFEAGACVSCEHYSGNDPELQAQVSESAKEGHSHVCTHTACYEVKFTTYWTAERQRLEAEGAVVYDEKQSNKIRYGAPGATRYATVSERIYPSDGPAVTLEHFLKLADAHKLDYSVAWLTKPGSPALERAVPHADMVTLAKALGFDHTHYEDDPEDDDNGDTPPTQDAEAAEKERQRIARAQAREREKIEVERQTRFAVARQLYAKWKGGIPRDQLRVMLQNRLEDTEIDIFERISGVKIGDDNGYEYKDIAPAVAKLSDTQLCAMLVLYDGMPGWDMVHSGEPTDLYKLAKGLRIDAAKIKAKVQAEVKAKAKEKAEKE